MTGNPSGSNPALPSGSNSAIRATSVVFDNDATREAMYIAGTDGSTMVVAAVGEESPLVGGTLDTSFGAAGTGIVSISGTSGANTIIQSQDPNTSHQLLVGGYATYSGTFGCGSCCGGGIPYNASDFTIVRLNT